MANSVLNQGNPTQGFDPKMMEQFEQFRKTFKGDPKQQVMKMIQQGTRSNQQLQQAMQMAKQMQGMFR